MKNDWKIIWNNRNTNDIDTVLEKLISLDGFDCGAGAITKDSWEEYCSYIISKLNIKNNETVFEYGCGSGALLYVLNKKFNIGVGGCDYSKVLIERALEYVGGEFYCASAVDIKPIKKYDYSISNSVFQYFSSYQYAINVVENMLKNTNRGIAILDVNDADKKEYAELKRRNMLSVEEYNKKYKGLEHRYYHKSWWNELSLKLDCDIIIENQVIKNYGNAEFRYNVFLKKRK